MPSSQGYQKVASEPVEPEPVAAKLAAEMSGIQQVVTGNPAGKIPATNSQQRLVLADSDSVASSQDEGDPEAPPGLPGDDDDSGVSSVGGMRSVTGKAWFTVSVLCFVNLINYMDRFTIAGVLTDIQSYFSIGDDEGGLLQTAFVLSYMICAPLFGYLGDRYSRKWIMALGVFLWSTTTLLGSFMHQFGWFITFRALVGIGEASYSTIAPTIISDLFVGDTRSKMLAMFYFAIPVGSGFGYIVGSETAKFFGSWAYALRVTPLLGIIAVVLIAMLEDPERGQSEGSHQMEVTSYREDIKAIVRNPSFMLSTAGFTCVAFVAGALAWWGPKFIYLGLVSQPGNENITLNDVSFRFGIIAMSAGAFGVPLGAYVARTLRVWYPSCDPLICAAGLFCSAPLVFLALVAVKYSGSWCFSLVFFAEISLNLTWSIVADMLLYVVVPTRRSTAEAFQILISHAFGDAGSPYFVGLISEAIKRLLRLTAASAALVFPADLTSYSQLAENATTTTTTFAPVAEDSPAIQFRALQYALFSTSFVEIIGGVFFLLTAMYILRDRRNVERAVAGCELELSESSSGSESHDQTLTQDSHSHNHAHHHASHSHPHSHRHQQRCARFPSEVAARSS
ncbi:protein spinster isoform X2 [Toxorhynchites rutilus septentrionalis]|uniref:protein spinster isoform X2 n=1 Tax=Toxorhynchites rutilus septentrionalis TaxID=329112 RepID=UPI00247AFEDB|nr:protein spinster isoform X2 [Toxorhynchites rutilus septentrionalis]